MHGKKLLVVCQGKEFEGINQATHRVAQRSLEEGILSAAFNAPD